jgi:hypothetical protein
MGKTICNVPFLLILRDTGISRVATMYTPWLEKKLNQWSNLATLKTQFAFAQLSKEAGNFFIIGRLKI